MQQYDENKIAPLVDLGVRQGKYPQRLFTYMPIDLMAERVDPIFRDCELYLSQPCNFNDPFDCRVYPATPTKEELGEYLIAQNEKLSDEQQEILRSGLDAIDVKAEIVNAIDKTMNKSGVRCFTPHRGNMLMWSHYANSHTGICLEFDVLQDCKFFVYPIKVHYSRTYPKIPYVDKKFIHHLLGTKSKVWKYEHELRVYKTAYGKHAFNPEALRSVTFGCKATDENIQHIIGTIRSTPSLDHVRFFRATTNRQAFKLDITEL